MSIPIEGLVSREPIQKNERHPDQGIPLLNNGNIPDILSQVPRRGNRFQSYLLAGLTLASPLLAACGSTVRAGESPSVPEATATAFTEVNPDVVPQVNIPGVGRVGVSTPEPATTGNPPKEVPTPVATAADQAKQVERTTDLSKCIFIKDPELCLNGQPVTRKGREDIILGIEYTLPPGTPIYTQAGNLSPRWNNQTQDIVGLSIDLPDGTGVNITGDNDLIIENQLVRKVSDGEIAARVGASGKVSFSIGVKRDPTTGQFGNPSQAFFEEHFPKEVLQKQKKILPSTGSAGPTASTQVVITKAFQ